MDPSVQAAITQAATEAGENPAFALAVADRESGGDPTATASRSIAGLYQMSGPLRQQYGIGNSVDPATQTQGWSTFMGDTRAQMAAEMGRAPSDAEAYLGHYFGAGRAARIATGATPPDALVTDVFTPQEMRENPQFAKAGTIGNLTSSIMGDINQRMARYGANVAPEAPSVAPAARTAPDFAQFGAPAGNVDLNVNNQGQPTDFAQYGTSPTEKAEAEPEGTPQSPHGGGSDLFRAFLGQRQASIERAAAIAQQPVKLPGQEVPLATLGAGGAPQQQPQAAPA
jgi:hypothetical protein